MDDHSVLCDAVLLEVTTALPVTTVLYLPLSPALIRLERAKIPGERLKIPPVYHSLCYRYSFSNHRVRVAMAVQPLVRLTIACKNGISPKFVKKLAQNAAFVSYQSLLPLK
jgi:hypothetical protein